MSQPQTKCILKCVLQYQSLAFVYTDILAQQAAQAQDKILQIGIDISIGNKLVITIPSAAPGKEAGSFALTGENTHSVGLSPYETERLARISQNNIVLQRLDLAEASSELMGETKQGEKSKTCRKPRSRGQDMPPLVRQLRKLVCKRPRKCVVTNEGENHEEGSPVPMKNQEKGTSCFLC